MTAPASTTSPALTPAQPVTDLRLSPEELKICEKWITPYSALLAMEDRLKILREAILPRLFLVNVGMAEEAWKACKSVSSILHPALDMVFTIELANKEVVSEPCPQCIDSILPVICEKKFPQASCLPRVQGGYCLNCYPVIWSKAWEAGLYYHVPSCHKQGHGHSRWRWNCEVGKNSGELAKLGAAMWTC